MSNFTHLHVHSYYSLMDGLNSPAELMQAAKELGSEFEFIIIGDGGTKKLLQYEIENLSISNVVLEKPVNRKELQGIYSNAYYLFIHLNDYPAFRKVLPSKIFELATFGKPIIAGVSGFAAEFIKNEVTKQNNP